jgi:hypothetical protein
MLPSTQMVGPLHQLLDDAIARGVCSAATISVGDAGREVLVDALGTTRTHPTPGETADDTAIFKIDNVTEHKKAAGAPHV